MVKLRKILGQIAASVSLRSHVAPVGIFYTGLYNPRLGPSAVNNHTSRTGSSDNLLIFVQSGIMAVHAALQKI